MIHNDVQLVILCGIPFSGKSTLADHLVQSKGFIRIDLDEIKFQLLGASIDDEHIDQADWDKVYQEMYQDIGAALDQGFRVVHDTGNFTRHERSMVNQIAKQRSFNFVTIFVDTPVDEASKRLEQNRKTKQRFNISGEAFQSAVDEMEKPTSAENPIIITPHDNIGEWIDLHF